MTWYYIIDNTTGRQVSESDTDPTPTLKPGRSVVVQPTRVDLTQLMWDETTRTFLVRPPPIAVDPLAGLKTDPNYLAATLTLSQAAKDQLNTAVTKLLSDNGVIATASLSVGM